jgi:hypothetical protein
MTPKWTNGFSWAKAISAEKIDKVQISKAMIFKLTPQGQLSSNLLLRQGNMARESSEFAYTISAIPPPVIPPKRSSSHCLPRLERRSHLNGQESTKNRFDNIRVSGYCFAHEKSCPTLQNPR